MKKKILFTLVLTTLTLACTAPELKAFVVLTPNTINVFEPLIKAITHIESCGGKYVYNKAENAVGWFQIRQIRVDDYNRRTGSNYKLEDFYDYELSEKCFLYFARGKTFEQAARRWNGSGPKTDIYWNKVLLALNL